MIAITIQEVGLREADRSNDRVAAAFDGIAGDDATAAVRAARTVLECDDCVRELLAPAIGESVDESAFVLRSTNIVLFDCPTAVIEADVLQVGIDAVPPATVIVPGLWSVMRFVRGDGARLRLWHAPIDAQGSAPCLPIGVLPVADGVVLTLDGRTRGHRIEATTEPVVVLTATIRAGARAPPREYAIADGRLVSVRDSGNS